MKVCLDDKTDSFSSKHIILQLEFHHIICKKVELPISQLSQKLFFRGLLESWRCIQNPGLCQTSMMVLFFLQKTLALCFKTLSKSSPPEVFLRKGVLEICSKFTGKSPYGLCNFIKITLRHRCFPVNLLHIFRKHFYEHTYGGLLLFVIFPEKC